jgi:hypothetical protein
MGRVSRRYEGNAARGNRRSGNRPGRARARDDDTDFANQLHTYNIYGPRDYNAWLGKILCDRLHKGVDANAFESTHFVAANLPRGTTQVQAWQFVAAAISYYCPDQTQVLKT